MLRALRVIACFLLLGAACGSDPVETEIKRVVRQTTPESSLQPGLQILRNLSGVRAEWRVEPGQPPAPYRKWLTNSLSPEYSIQSSTARTTVYRRVLNGDVYHLRADFSDLGKEVHFVLDGEPF